MQLRDNVRKYMLEENYNCAETILLAANDYYDLGIKPEEMHLVSAFGGGMQCGQICGALTGSFAVLGRMYVSDRAHTNPDLRRMGTELFRAFVKKTGNSRCADLKPVYMKEGTRCLGLVMDAADVLQEFVEAHPIP